MASVGNIKHEKSFASIREQKKRTASEEMMVSRKNFSQLIRGNKSDYGLPKTEVFNLSLL